jgi:hypothetical protein
MACLLAVLMPFELASRVLARLTGVAVNASSVWHWAQARGREAMARLDEELKRLAQGERPAPETLAAEMAALPVMVGVDGVKVPLRPHGGDPRGAVVWREVKVGILARFCHRVRESGEHAFAIKQRRVVAVLGDIEALKPRLRRESVAPEYRAGPASGVAERRRRGALAGIPRALRGMRDWHLGLLPRGAERLEGSEGVEGRTLTAGAGVVGVGATAHALWLGR